VLHNWQQLRLDVMAPADHDSPRAQRLRESFDMLVRHLRTLPPVESRVVRGAVFAETLQGKVIVANEALADLSRPPLPRVMAPGRPRMFHLARAAPATR
jgi:hypothetical protein